MERKRAGGAGGTSGFSFGGIMNEIHEMLCDVVLASLKLGHTPQEVAEAIETFHFEAIPYSESETETRH